MEFRVLALGDVTSEDGTRHLARTLRPFQKVHGVDFTVVNGENVSGVGLTPDQAEDLFAAGADVITLEAKKQQEENRKLCGRAYNKEYLGYVCVDVIGNLIKPNYVSSTFGKLLAKNNLRHIRFHDLRHTCASLLLANGVPMEQVKEWLGHSEISTTVDIYGHLQYATKKQSAAAIEQDIVAPMLQNLSAVSP